MKLIKQTKYNNFIDYIYENDIVKRIWNDGEVYWIKNNCFHKEDGAAKKNCIGCIENRCWNTNKYKRHFALKQPGYINAMHFAEKTEHKICLICNDFCNQECFLKKNKLTYEDACTLYSSLWSPERVKLAIANDNFALFAKENHEILANSGWTSDSLYNEMHRRMHD